MLNSFNSLDLFWAYYETWIKFYKEGAIRKPTMDKYLLTLYFEEEDIKQTLSDLNFVKILSSLLETAKVVESLHGKKPLRRDLTDFIVDNFRGR